MLAEFRLHGLKRLGEANSHVSPKMTQPTTQNPITLFVFGHRKSPSEHLAHP
jgi:hypothetical protein